MGRLKNRLGRIDVINKIRKAINIPVNGDKKTKDYLSTSQLRLIAEYIEKTEGNKNATENKSIDSFSSIRV
jgi:hypothetical protein